MSSEPRKRWWSPARIGVAAAACALIVAALWQTFPTQNIIRSEQGEIRLIQASYGMRHRYIDGPALHRILGSLLPTSIASMFGIQQRVEITSQPTLMVFLECEGVTSTPQFPSFLRVIDEQGLASNTETVQRSMQTSNRLFTTFVVRSFPRHDRTLRLELSYFPGPSKRERKVLGDRYLGRGSLHDR